MTLKYQLEPKNELDKFAVQILANSKIIGYIPSYFSKEVAEAVNAGRYLQIKVLDVKPISDENWHELVKADLAIS